MDNRVTYICLFTLNFFNYLSLLRFYLFYSFISVLEFSITFLFCFVIRNKTQLSFLNRAFFDLEFFVI